jgi:hypothetical protein
VDNSVLVRGLGIYSRYDVGKAFCSLAVVDSRKQQGHFVVNSHSHLRCPIVQRSGACRTQLSQLFLQIKVDHEEGYGLRRALISLAISSESGLSLLCTVFGSYAIAVCLLDYTRNWQLCALT